MGRTKTGVPLLLISIHGDCGCQIMSTTRTFCRSLGFGSLELAIYQVCLSGFIGLFIKWDDSGPAFLSFQML